jgi:hypothetical protein
MNRLDPNNDEEYRRCYLVADESSRYHGPVLPLLIAESRKTATSLILANQYMSRW